MIVIDQHAETKLINALDALRDQPGSTRCLHFPLAGTAHGKTSADIRQKVIESAQLLIPSQEPQIYLCEDGDIFILAPALSSKDAHKLALEIAGFLGVPADADIYALYEMSQQVNKVADLIEAKFARRKKAMEIELRNREMAMQERKRHAILHGIKPQDQLQDMAARRKEREQPELMIIEDDGFSCRLVENVLQKKYQLTALHTAERALETYIRLAPDVLFLDINLPDVTGHELLEQIMKIDPSAYVIMLSGNSDRDNISMAMGKGAKGFIAKPFTREKIHQYIERCPTIKKATS